MDTENDVLDSAVQEQQEQPVVEAPAQDAPATQEPVAEEQQEQVTRAANDPPKWALDRIGEETSKRRAAERELAELRETMARSKTQSSQAEPPATPRAEIPADFERQVDQAAEMKAASAAFARDTADVAQAGHAANPKFGETLRILAALDFVTNTDIVADLMSVDKANAHAILDKLAKSPERAVAIARLNSRARIAEFTRLSMAESKPNTAGAAESPKAAPKPVSAAPPPRPRHDPSSVPVNDWMNDEATDEQFFDGWKRKYLKAG